MKQRAAKFLIHHVYHNDKTFDKAAAYSSIMTAMGIDEIGRPSLETEEDLQQNIDWNLVEAFKTKYGI